VSPGAVRRAARPSAALVFERVLVLVHVATGFAHAHVVSSTPAAEAVLALSPPSLSLEFDSALADTCIPAGS
jgi:methionine-rich copper-binding protein CopC